MDSWKALLFLLSFICCCSSSSATKVTYDGRAIKIDGERRILISGAIHYPRSTAGMWPDLLQKAKEGGLDAIETYVFWNMHEPRRRKYNFEGDLDLIKFIKLVHETGLYLVLRIGPYVCAEWDYGGFPVWLHQIPGIQLRTDNKIYKDEMQTFVTLIVNMIKKENLLAPQGGPIIIAQIENEYGNVMGPYGAAGQAYIKWCAKLAESFNIDVPWIMCQQPNAPWPMINTCNGYYCDNFQPNSPNSPKMWTENWAGWFQPWGGAVPHRAAEDVAFAVARFFQSGGSFQNYYMYHGGTNFGRTSGGPFLVTAYDYDAPLDEYGNIRQPKWGHLKQLHAAIKQMEKALAYGDSNTTNYGNLVSATKYTYNSISSCFLANANTSVAANLHFEGNYFFLPPWSVSLLPDCKQEVYNTAKVNTQTSVMVKKATVGLEDDLPFIWGWRDEVITDTLIGNGSFSTDQILEQMNTTSDTSDYLWYMTGVVVSAADIDSSANWTLHVKTKGHLLHAYVNGILVGSQYGSQSNNQFVFEAQVNLQEPYQHIALLSGTVGLANYGANFDLDRYGIDGGPVQLISTENKTIDLSSNIWSYKIGLNGEELRLYDKPQRFKWRYRNLSTNSPMTWYKTFFVPPIGCDPLALDLQGMGKGQAWVNGHNIGRYWPSLIAPQEGCDVCHYNKSYQDSDCQTGCGGPSQRWYHVPRSYTRPGRNTLVLFEEAGGDPTNVKFDIVRLGHACAHAHEGSHLEFSCHGNRTISEVHFASFGDPLGTCGSFAKGSCESPDALAAVQKACIGKSKCTFNVTKEILGSSECSDLKHKLAVQVGC